MHRSGIKVVDHVIGGLAPGLPLVLAGPAGCGRTVLSLQLAAAALAQDNIVAFLSAEPAPLLLRQAETLSLDLETPVRDEQLILLELDPRAPTSLVAGGGRSLVEAIQREHPAIGTILIDPFTAVTTEIVDEVALRAVAREMLAAAPTTTLVLTVETERPMLDAPVERVLSEVCGSFLTLGRRASGVRTLTVGKTRAGAGRAEAVEFTIGERGAELVREIPAEHTEPAVSPPPVSASPTPIAPPPAVTTDPPAGVAPEPEPAGTPVPAPITAPTPVEVAAASADTRANATGPRRVLVVDEDPASAARISEWLSDRYHVVVAPDGLQAMALLLRDTPDLILLDLELSRVTGLELLTALRRTGQPIPILVITHRRDRPGDRLGPLVLGASDVLMKPVERFELLQKVETVSRLVEPVPALMDLDDAQALFGNASASRQLPAADFRDRVARACDFGRRFGASSSLLAIEAESPEQLDLTLEAADAVLRFEDAVLVLTKKSALVLLVATDTHYGTVVVERLATHLLERVGELPELRFRVHPALSPDELGDFRALFDELVPLSGGTP